jgi:ATP-dependent DNA helicase RecG
MSVRFLGPDPLEAELNRVLGALARGHAPRAIERRLVDCKEEPGRRQADGTIRPGAPQSDAAAQYLAEEAACFANSAGGGALVVGVDDRGTPIGTALDAEWLRHRIYELTERRLTVTVREGDLTGVRILVLIVPEALEPVAYRSRLRWRVGDHCVPVDAASWWAGRLTRLGYDWSAQATAYPLEAARPDAIERARGYLRASHEPGAQELAGLPDADLLRRLNAVTGEGRLTNAAVLVFVGREAAPALDYLRRDRPGGDSRLRLRRPGQSLIEELAAVEQAIAAHNPLVHLPSGFAVGQLTEIPPLTIREAIVNGLAHRDWATDSPTTVEHVGTTLVVMSPGGFVGGVTAENIITHPSAPRHRALADLLAKLRIAEREGVGVDRMVRDMLRYGHGRPAIEEIPGPMIRTALVGGMPDATWIGFLDELQPPSTGHDLDALLLLDQLIQEGWTDEPRAASALQKTQLEAAHALAQFEHGIFRDGPILARVAGTTGHAAWRLSDRVRRHLAPRLGGWLSPDARPRLIVTWARHRGRVSTTEVSDLAGISIVRAGAVLKALEAQGDLAPGRALRSGRGFFYTPRVQTEGDGA